MDKVFNYAGAVGGTDPWTFDQIVDLGPQAIKNRGRAVSVEDYEWVTMAAFGQVARAKGLATKKPGPGGVLLFKPGAVSLVVVPKGPQRTPQPPRGLLRRIEAYLRRRAFGTIIAEIYALPPLYTEVSIAATVKAAKPQEISVLPQRVVQALEAFFHPLTGGERGEGVAVRPQRAPVRGVRSDRAGRGRRPRAHGVVRRCARCLQPERERERAGGVGCSPDHGGLIMALPTIQLDDRTFEQLAGFLRKQIDTSRWVDHNYSDPGIALIDLLCWIGKMILFRADRIPPAHVQRFASLILDFLRNRSRCR